MIYFRTSHGVGQYDLERAATWALIGKNQPEQPQPQHQSFETAANNTETVNDKVQCSDSSSEIDYKKVNHK